MPNENEKIRRERKSARMTKVSSRSLLSHPDISLLAASSALFLH